MRGGGSRLALALVSIAALAGCTQVATAAASSTNPPKITIATPRNGEVLTQPTVTVKGSFKVAPFDGPSPKVSATLNGKQIETSVNGSISYEFRGTASLKKGSDELVVAVDDGNGGTSTASVTVTYKPLRPTRRQCVSDKRGDSRDRRTHMDIVTACAQRRGAKVIFSVTTAKPPPNIHDSFGNPTAPCLEILRASPKHAGPAPIQTCGDATLRGYTLHNWPKVPFSISGRVSKWKVPLKYLPKKSFQWRAYISDADHYRDKAPDKGFLTFLVG